MAIASIIKTLAAQDVEFVVVGGMAAVLQGAPFHTIDLEIVYALSEPNIERLQAALDELDTVFRDDSRQIRPNRSHLRSRGHPWLLVADHPRKLTRIRAASVPHPCRPAEFCCPLGLVLPPVPQSALVALRSCSDRISQSRALQDAPGRSASGAQKWPSHRRTRDEQDQRASKGRWQMPGASSLTEPPSGGEEARQQQHLPGSIPSFVILPEPPIRRLRRGLRITARHSESLSGRRASPAQRSGACIEIASPNLRVLSRGYASRATRLPKQTFADIGSVRTLKQVARSFLHD
jgi:hypothetical protein